MDPPIHTSKVDGGILSTVLLYSDSRDSSAGKTHWSALQYIGCSLWSKEKFSPFLFDRSRSLDQFLLSRNSRRWIEIWQLGWPLLNWMNFNPSMASFIATGRPRDEWLTTGQWEKSILPQNMQCSSLSENQLWLVFAWIWIYNLKLWKIKICSLIWFFLSNFSLTLIIWGLIGAANCIILYRKNKNLTVPLNIGNWRVYTKPKGGGGRDLNKL